MKKIAGAILAASLFLTAGYSVSAAENAHQKPFTAEQQNELRKLHQDLHMKQKELINKYVEYGALPREKADKILRHFDKKYEMLQQNGFQFPQLPHHHKHERQMNE